MCFQNGKNMYILDTDILIGLARGNFHLQEKVIKAGINKCAISEISLAELYVGSYKKRPLKKSNDLAIVMAELFSSLPITPALKTYGRIRAQLELQGNSLEDMDLFIAATAIANNYTLISGNTKHFSRIPGLKLKDWTEE